ncbi:MAG: SemiSWEET transporter [Armatimonadetes bacterium]|nr:SemiSWEET transporter [Armatimonadota bacterium]
MDYIRLLGFAAGAVGVIAFVPQAVKVLRTRSTHDLSLPSYLMMATGSILWAAYGFLQHDLPIILPNVIILLLQLTILWAKFRFH